jgi:hypothetical protein
VQTANLKATGNRTEFQSGFFDFRKEKAYTVELCLYLQNLIILLTIFFCGVKIKIISSMQKRKVKILKMKRGFFNEI